MDKMEKEKKKTKRPVIICVCGMAGSGKSTLAKKLAERYKLKYYSGGDTLKALAIEEGYKSVNRGWWERKEGMRFLEERTEDPKFDKIVDRKLLQVANDGNVVLDSWTMPWLIKKGFKIWLEASTEKRAERIAKRDEMSVTKAIEALKIKDKQTKNIYKKLYGFRLGDDFEPFHLILDTENLDAEEVFQVLVDVVENMVLNRH